MKNLLKNFAQFGLFVFIFAATSCNIDPNASSDNKKTVAKEADANFKYPDGSRPLSGCLPDKAAYEKTLAYEQLDGALSSNELPSAYSLLEYAPKRKSQGQRGSCTAWANAYAARTISKAVATGQNPTNIAFSPAFLYNQLSDCDKGISLVSALSFMKLNGVLELDEFPYTDQNCDLRPNSSEKQVAKENKISGFTRLSMGGNNYDIDVQAIKQHITQKCPVIIAQNVPETFSQAYNSSLWQPSQSELSNPQKLIPHAMCIIGYDDNKYGGAFHIMNSWGDDWGDDGCIWVTYEDFSLFGIEAYAMHPERNQQKISADVFELSFGLQLLTNNKLGDFIKLTDTQMKANGASFLNKTKLKEGDKFKIVVENSKDCYIYILSYENSDGSFTVFPYEKVSAYFGVTGTRTFPKKKSFTMEGSNDVDYMTIIASKEELDIDAINSRITQSSKPYYSERVDEALKKDAVPSQNWVESEGTVSFEGDRKNKKLVYVVFNLNKN
jgi:C1A family cysteine protease